MFSLDQTYCIEAGAPTRPIIPYKGVASQAFKPSFWVLLCHRFVFSMGSSRRTGGTLRGVVLRKHSSKRQASNRKRQVFTVATFNIQRISHIKMEAIIQDGYDLMALTELGGRPEEPWELDVKYPGRVFCNEPSDLSDPAAGAAVILSKRMSKHVMTHEAVGTRIVWVRLQGMHYNLLFVAAYIPQPNRAAPNRAQTLQELESTCRTLRKRYPSA